MLTCLRDGAPSTCLSLFALDITGDTERAFTVTEVAGHMLK